MRNCEQPVDWHKFNHPKIVFAEKVIPAGKSEVIQQHELKVSRDMVVHYLAISDNTFTEEAHRVTAPNDTYLRWLRVNWSVVERASWLPIGFGSMSEFHNFFECDASNFPIDPNSILGTPAYFRQWGPLRWRYAEPWVYNPIDSLSIDLVSPPPPTAINQTRFVNVFWDGVGMKSGLRRSFLIPGSPIPGQALGVPFAQSFSQPQLASNLGDEAFKMQAMGVEAAGREWENAGPVDLRLLNHFRLRCTPSIGDSHSDTAVPLVFYGLHQRPAWRLAIHKPAGGPIFLYAGQSIIFNIENPVTAADFDVDVPITAQVALIGATAPAIGSLT